MSPPRRHHLLPRFYMRGFADAREKVRVVPLHIEGQPPRAPFVTGLSNALVERDFYSVPDADGELLTFMEEGYSFMESHAASALERMLTVGLKLSDDERQAWATFMAMQMTRTQHFRDQIGQFTSDLGQRVIALYAANADDDHPVFDGSPPTAEQRRMLMSGDGFTVRPSRAHEIELSMAGVEKLASAYERMAWCLMHFPQRCLITSDLPITRWRHRDALGGRLLGGAPEHGVRIPLSADKALVLVMPFLVADARDLEVPGDLRAAAELNVHVGGVARALIAPPDLERLAWPTVAEWTPSLARHGAVTAVDGSAWASPWPMNVGLTDYSLRHLPGRVVTP